MDEAAIMSRLQVGAGVDHMGILKIAVTGSAGSGKSHVCRAFQKLGLAILDCDVIARQVVEPGRPGFNAVITLFGRGVLQRDGTLDRAQLRSLIINNPESRKQMENILHPRILDEMNTQMTQAHNRGFAAVAVEVPLLFETGMDRFFDVTIAVTGSQNALARRISERDAVTIEDAQKMLEMQMPQEEKMKKADYVIQNMDSLPELFESVGNIYRKIEKEFLTT